MKTLLIATLGFFALNANAGGLPPKDGICDYFTTKYTRTCSSDRFHVDTGEAVMNETNDFGSKCPYGGVAVKFREVVSHSGEGFGESLAYTDSQTIALRRKNFEVISVKFSANGKRAQLVGKQIWPGGEDDGKIVRDTLNCADE